MFYLGVVQASRVPGIQDSEIIIWERHAYGIWWKPYIKPNMSP